MNILLLLMAFLDTSLKIYGEEVGYSFQTEDGSVVSFITGSQNEYMVFRFGSPHSILIEFPHEVSSSSWDQFSYSSYFRPGGEQNEGLEIYTITFLLNDSLIEIYETFYAVGPVYETGIIITAGQDTVYHGTGVFDSRVGSMNQIQNSFHQREVLN
ncbi:MAG: hypothetical protein U9P42_04130 [Candidatus Fermentibacteria bacterium]|nr:hypothetical protein [Candidatus Fermentibacteria bacterium]